MAVQQNLIPKLNRSESVGKRSVQVFAGKVIKDSYLLSDRQDLEGGLGGQVTNNDSEKLNSLIKQHFSCKIDPLTSLSLTVLLS